MNSKELEQNYQQAQKDVEQNPDSPKHFALLGEYAEKLGYFNEAIDAYSEVAALDPKNFLAALRVGILFTRQKKYDLAIPFFQKAIKTKPNFSPALLSYGLMHAQAGNISDAEELFFKVLQIQPNNPAAVHNLFKILFEQHHYEECEKLLSKALTMIKNNQLLYSDYGILAVKQNDPLKAIDMFTKGINLDLKSKHAIPLYSQLFHVLFALKNYDKARQLMHQGLQHFSDEMEFKDNLYILEKHLIEQEEKKENKEKEENKKKEEDKEKSETEHKNDKKSQTFTKKRREDEYI